MLRYFSPYVPERVHPVCVPVVLFLVAALTTFTSYHLFLPSRDFPQSALVHIPETATVYDMAHILADHNIIRSPFMFRVYARLTGQDRSLANGPYVFEEPVGLVTVVHRIAEGKHGIESVRITFTEGMTVRDMGETLETQLPGFDVASFYILASTSEGYLFPDTYFFIPGTTPEEVVERLSLHFTEQIKTIEADIVASGRSLEELVTMASLLEREAQTEEDMRIVSGILWNRIDEGMLLQVDAVFGYIHDENGYTPTAADLESDSKYNTYKYEGLPPTPIANPGLVALKAAAIPAATEYFYYLTGRDGNMYYGHTFEEHKRNRELYLD